MSAVAVRPEIPELLIAAAFANALSVVCVVAEPAVAATTGVAEPLPIAIEKSPALKAVPSTAVPCCPTFRDELYATPPT